MLRRLYLRPQPQTTTNTPGTKDSYTPVSYTHLDVYKRQGKIHIMVEEKETFVNITVTDNGSGIEAGDMEHIWDLGYSDKQSTGLGLPFVRQVIAVSYTHLMESLITKMPAEKNCWNVS